MNRKLAILILLFPLVSNSLRAQEQFTESPAELLTRFPFRMLTGGVILFSARLNDFPDTLNFILDTGSGGISLDSSTVAYFGLVPEPSERTVLGIGGIRKVDFLYNQTLDIPGLKVDSLNFHINDYEILTSVYGEKIDGIAGYSLFSRYIVKINYDSLKIEFYTPGSIKYPRGGTLLEPILRTLPVQQARIKDNITVNSRFLFDIGAGLNLLLTKDFIEDSNFLHRKRVLFTKEAEGLGGKVDMHITVIKEFKLGPYRFRSVPVYIFNDIYNITSYPYLSGIIGNDIMRRFNIIINYAKSQFYITPNSHYNDLFDYSYIGVELYYLDGMVILGDVAKGSPAEEAGLMEGDKVVAINKNFSQNLQQLKQSLQEMSSKVKFIVEREGELLQFEFKVKSIRKKALRFSRKASF